MKKKILLIDDDVDIIRSFRTMFEIQGFDVITAPETKEGLEKLIKEKPDLMVLDVMMNSNLEGFNMLNIIKQEHKMMDLPIILLTGIKDELGVNLLSAVEDENMYPNVVFEDKPIDPVDLLELINEKLA